MSLASVICDDSKFSNSVLCVCKECFILLFSSAAQSFSYVFSNFGVV